MPGRILDTPTIGSVQLGVSVRCRQCWGGGGSGVKTDYMQEPKKVLGIHPKFRRSQGSALPFLDMTEFILVKGFYF